MPLIEKLLKVHWMTKVQKLKLHLHYLKFEIILLHLLWFPKIQITHLLCRWLANAELLEFCLCKKLVMKSLQYFQVIPLSKRMLLCMLQPQKDCLLFEWDNRLKDCLAFGWLRKLYLLWLFELIFFFWLKDCKKIQEKCLREYEKDKALCRFCNC